MLCGSLAGGPRATMHAVRRAPQERAQLRVDLAAQEVDLDSGQVHAHTRERRVFNECVSRGVATQLSAHRLSACFL